MEPEQSSQNEQIPEQEHKLGPLKKVTPLSRYLAMALFIALPFIGGWIGYTLMPEKVVEVERVVVNESGKLNNMTIGSFTGFHQTKEVKKWGFTRQCHYFVVEQSNDALAHYYSQQAKLGGNAQNLDALGRLVLILPWQEIPATDQRLIQQSDSSNLVTLILRHAENDRKNELLCESSVSFVDIAGTEDTEFSEAELLDHPDKYQISDGWVTLPVCNPGRNETYQSITFPLEMGMKISKNPYGACYDLAYEFHPFIPESTDPHISIYLLTDKEDLRFLSFVKYSETDTSERIELYVADTQKKELYLVDSHTSDGLEFADHNTASNYYSRGSLIDDSGRYYLAYRWWNTDEAASVGETVNKVFSLDSKKTVFATDCLGLGGGFGPYRDLVKSNIQNNKLVFVNCANDIVYTDFDQVHEVPIPDSIKNPILYGFVGENRIKFFDGGVTNEMLDSPVYSVNLDGSNFVREEEEQYRGF